mgnify:CR=1 FL=1
MEFRLAYRNEGTDREWVKVVDGNYTYCHDRALNLIKDCPNSEVAIFALTSSTTPWYDRKPRVIMNRQPNNDPIPASIGGLINHYYVPGKNPR